MPTRILRSLLRSRVVGIGIGLVVTAALLWRTGPDKVGQSLAHASPWFLVAAVALNAPSVLLRSWRSRLVLQRLDARVPMWRLTTSQLIGLTLSGITPAAGGDLIRAYLWNRQDGVPVRTGALVVAFERVWSLVLMGLFGLAAAAIVVDSWPLRLIAVVSWVCLGLPWIADRLGLLSWALTQLARLPLVRRKATQIERSAGEVALISEDLVLQFEFLALSLGIFALGGVQVWLLVIGVGGLVPYAAAIAAYCLSQVGGAISTLPFGLGAGDALLVVILAQSGLAAHSGAGVAILLRIATTLPIAVAAVIAWAVTLPTRTAALERVRTR